MTIWENILPAKKAKLEARKKALPLVDFESKLKPSQRNFFELLVNRPTSWPALIAEIKPSLQEKYSLEISIKIFDHHAVAISVLTEEDYWGGELASLKVVREKSERPLLQRDLIFDPYQILEARLLGADAFWLLASLLSTAELNTLLDLGRRWGMEGVVELGNEEELDKALDAGAEILALKAQGGKAAVTQYEAFENLLALVPDEKLIIAYGNFSRFDELRLLRGRVEGVLVDIWEQAADLEKKADQLAGAPLRKFCGLTSIAHCSAAIELGADYLGLIFSPSERQVATIEAEKISQQFGKTNKLVGVFADETVEFISQKVQKHGLQVVQLNGAESQQFCTLLRNALPKTVEIWKVLLYQDETTLERAAVYNTEGIGFKIPPEKIDLASAVLQYFDPRPGQKLILAGDFSLGEIEHLVPLVRPEVISLLTLVAE